MIRYILKKDLKSIGKAGTVVAWSLQNQLEYAHLFGLLDKWPEIFNDYFEEIKEEPKEVFTWDDEKVSKIVADAHRDGFHKEPLGIYDRIQNFKQSKPDTSKERSVEDIGRDAIYSLWKSDRLFPLMDKMLIEKTYTQQDLDKAIEQTWKACRETTDQPIGRGEYNDGDCGDLYRNKYPTLESYLLTLK